MRYVILVSILFSCKSIKPASENILLGTKWKLISFIPSIDFGEAKVAQYSFTIEFKEKGKLSSEIFRHCNGKYKIKASKIYVSLGTSVSYDSALESFKGGAGLAMHYHRKYMIEISGRFLPYEVNGNELRIKSERWVLLFTKV